MKMTASSTSSLIAHIPISEADDGKSVDAKVGDTMTLRLHENASTGYRWAFDALDEAKLALMKSGVVRDGDNKSVGKASDMTWTLKAKAKGTTLVKLKLWRSFEGDKSIQQRFAVTLKIR